jgi:type I restriction enzyme R subunit
MTSFTESVVEESALAWLGSLGYAVSHGTDVAVGEPAAERRDPNYRDVVLERNLAVYQCPRQTQFTLGERG